MVFLRRLQASNQLHNVSFGFSKRVYFGLSLIEAATAAFSLVTDRIWLCFTSFVLPSSNQDYIYPLTLYNSFVSIDANQKTSPSSTSRTSNSFFDPYCLLPSCKRLYVAKHPFQKG